MRLYALLLLLPMLAPAQSPRPEDLGTVSGHITCADTQGPARGASVMLVPVKPADDSDRDAEFNDWGKYGPVHTDLTGTYTLTKVPPGQYYLRVDLDGYITPISQFTPEELRKPAPETQQRMHRELQLVTISPKVTTQADATIRRGGSISGTVLYDDGSPAINIDVTELRRDPRGNFRREIQTFHTDSHGRYSLDSLSPGDYLILVELEVHERRLGTVNFGDFRSRQAPVDVLSYSLPIYSGSVFRRKDAETIKVDAGQQSDDVDITIPLSRLHEISGTILANDGHTINSGIIDLRFADTRERLAAVSVRDDGTFDLPFIPDGSYILRVAHAGDVERVFVPPGNGIAYAHTEEHPLHTYGDLSQPITVTSDIQSLNLVLSDKPSAAPSE